jgi:sugar phosphate isomerase/epimerase
MREIGINLDVRSEMEIPTFCDTLRDCGFTRVFMGAGTPGYVRFMANYVTAAGLTFDTLHAPFHGINSMWHAEEDGDLCLQRLTDSIDLCAEIGAPIAVVHLSSGENAPPTTDIGRARFIRLVEHAAARGIKIAFENQRKLANIAWAFEEFKDTTHVGFCWDCGHEGCFTPGRRYMPLFGERLICTHLHDNDGVYNHDQHLLPYDGSLDYNAVATDLRHATPTVPLVLEVNRDHYDGMTDEEFILRAAKAAKRLRDMIEKG